MNAKFMRPLIILILLSLALAGIAPLASGLIAKYSIDQFVKQANQSSRVTVKLVEYHPGWTSSDAVFSFYIKNTDLPDAPTVFVATAKINLEHGPIIKNPIDNHYSIGISGFRASLQLSSELSKLLPQSETTNNAGLPSTIKAEGMIALGTLNGVINIIKNYHYSNPHSDILISDAGGPFSLSLGSTGPERFSFYAKINLGSLQWTQDSTSTGSLQNAYFEAKYSRARDWNSSLSMTISTKTLKTENFIVNSPELNYRVVYNNTNKNDDYMQFSINKVSSFDNLLKVNNLQLSFSGLGIDEKFLKTFFSFINSFSSGSIPEQNKQGFMQDGIINILDKFYSDLMVNFHVDTLYSTTPIQNNKTLSLGNLNIAFQLKNKGDRTYQIGINSKLANLDLTNLCNIRSLSLSFDENNINVGKVIRKSIEVAGSPSFLKLDNDHKILMLSENLLPLLHFDSQFSLGASFFSCSVDSHTYLADNLKLKLSRYYDKDFANYLTQASITKIASPFFSAENSSFDLKLKNINSQGLDLVNMEYIKNVIYHTKPASSREPGTTTDVNRMFSSLISPSTNLEYHLSYRSDTDILKIDSNAYMNPQEKPFNDMNDIFRNIHNKTNVYTSISLMNRFLNLIAARSSEEYLKSTNKNVTPEEEKILQKKFIDSYNKKIADYISKGYLKEDPNGYSSLIEQSNGEIFLNGIKMQKDPILQPDRANRPDTTVIIQ